MEGPIAMFDYCIDSLGSRSCDPDLAHHFEAIYVRTHDVVQVQSVTWFLCLPCSLLELPSYYMLVPRQTTIEKSHRSSSDALDRIRRGFNGG